MALFFLFVRWLYSLACSEDGATSLSLAASISWSFWDIVFHACLKFIIFSLYDFKPSKGLFRLIVFSIGNMFVVLRTLIVVRMGMLKKPVIQRSVPELQCIGIIMVWEGIMCGMNDVSHPLVLLFWHMEVLYEHFW